MCGLFFVNLCNVGHFVCWVIDFYVVSRLKLLCAVSELRCCLDLIRFSILQCRLVPNTKLTHQAITRTTSNLALQMPRRDYDRRCHRARIPETFRRHGRRKVTRKKGHRRPGLGRYVTGALPEGRGVDRGGASFDGEGERRTGRYRQLI